VKLVLDKVLDKVEKEVKIETPEIRWTCKKCKRKFKRKFNWNYHHCWALARYCRICDEMYHVQKGHVCYG
jgi:hypothetical protein